MRQRLPDIRLQTLLQTSVSRHSSRHLSPDSPPDICLQPLHELPTTSCSPFVDSDSRHLSPDSPRTSDNVLFTIRRQRLQRSVSRLSMNFRQRSVHHSSTATPCDEDNHGWLVTDDRLARPPHACNAPSLWPLQQVTTVAQVDRPTVQRRRAHPSPTENAHMRSTNLTSTPPRLLLPPTHTYIH